MTIPVISLAHLPLKSMKALHQYGDRVPWMICAPYTDGAFISVPSDLDENLLHKSLLDGLRDILTWAKKGGYEWVRLDVAGDTVPELPTYGW
ncbi:hypothetical protein GGI1_12590 [Acidithiobacillus sp. GGI-221]|nr:hypothetical protein GGI1_12590 [Acidithiobacillus sp. GGI-221]